MSGRYSNSASLSGKPSFKNGLRGFSSSASSMCTLNMIEFKTKMIDTIMIPFMSQDWRVLEENMFLMDLFREEIDRNPNADICVYKDLIMAIETVFAQQQEISILEKRLYGGREDMTTMVVKLGGIRLKPELELCNLIWGTPDHKKGERHDANMVNDVSSLMKNPRATFANISKYIKHKYKR